MSLQNVHARGRRILALLSLIQLVTIAACARYSAPAQVRPDVTSHKTEQQAARNQEAVVQTLVASLSSADDAVLTAAERELLNIASQSSEGRDAVIKEVLASVRLKPELDGSHLVLTPATFRFWKSVTAILSTLKATEGVDAMITCVHCSNGYSGNMGEPPASIALVQIGPIAIPKLSAALSQEVNGYKRIKIILCLSRIGGPEAELV